MRERQNSLHNDLWFLSFFGILDKEFTTLGGLKLWHGMMRHLFITFTLWE